MESYIIRIYRRDGHDHPLAGTVEMIEKDINRSDKYSFNDRQTLWELLSLPDKSKLNNISDLTKMAED